MFFRSISQISSMHKGSSELGSGHTKMEGVRTDAAQVSSGIFCIGFSEYSFPISVPQSNNRIFMV